MPVRLHGRAAMRWSCWRRPCLPLMQVVENKKEVDWRRQGVFVAFGFAYLVGARAGGQCRCSRACGALRASASTPML